MLKTLKTPLNKDKQIFCSSGIFLFLDLFLVYPLETNRKTAEGKNLCTGDQSE